MTDIFSKAAHKANVQANTPAPNAVQTPVQANSKGGYESLPDKLQKAVIYAAFYAVYQKSGTLYNQASVDSLLSNVEKALDTDAYTAFASNVGVIANALQSVQANIITPLSADDIIRDALDNAPDESPKAVLNRLISEKAISGADARRYLERLLGW